jgi:hypothetical protein
VDLSVWITYLVATIILSVSPGPGVFSSLAAGLNHGFRRGMWNAVGMQVANFTLMAFVSDHPEADVELDLKTKQVLFGNRRMPVPVEMRDSARTLFLEGLWDSSATLLSAMDAVRAKASNLPYMNWRVPSVA